MMLPASPPTYMLTNLNSSTVNLTIVPIALCTDHQFYTAAQF